MISIFVPAIIAGSMFGVKLNMFLPPIVIIILLSYFLITSSIKFYANTLKFEENEKIKKIL